MNAAPSADFVALAAFMVADAERQCELAGTTPTLATWGPAVERCGRDATIFVLRVRGRMQFAEADALDAFGKKPRLVRSSPSDGGAVHEAT
jgi:hypothetical protein